eukprot:Tbor_TRINITY_DN5411_c0_g2::TRINITY_DN5411_c0_g2_i1::g.24328::m.24328/K15437/AIMP1, ARC1; aminoacyl tRNA synthase complex-interacting multifunctional protein 1
MSPKYLLAAASPIKFACRHVLLACKVSPSDIDTECPKFSIQNGFDGLAAILYSVYETDKINAAPILGGDRETKAVINQWVSVAQKVSLGFTSIADVEPLMPSSQEYLAGGVNATAADVLLFAACRHSMFLATQTGSSAKVFTTTYPTIMKWIAHVEQKSELVKSFLAENSDFRDMNIDSSASDNVKEAVLHYKPSAEEIERRRMEKEKLKAEKEASKKAAETTDAAAATTDKKPKKGNPPPAQVDPSAFFDFRVGRIEEIANHPDADKLFVETIDLGTEKRTIVSGLRDHYTSDDLKGKLCVVVCNMKEKPLKGVNSHGMVLCAGPSASVTKVQLVEVPTDTVPGTRVLFGADAKEAPKVIPAVAGGNKMADNISFLRTDNTGQVLWKDTPLRVASGALTSSITDAPVK